MIAAITAVATSALARPQDAGRRAAPNLEAQLNTYRAQLEDWVTCPSAKTPEGKAKIEQITKKLDSVRSEIKKRKEPPANGESATPPLEAALRPKRAADPDSALGQNIDTFA